MSSNKTLAPQRADLALVARGLFPSRAKAQEAIAAGLVEAGGRRIVRASDPIAPEAQITAEAPYPWVSRGGVKLAAALDHFRIDPAGLACLDIGASTGGFTDVLLAGGARHVTAVDVGRGQLHPRLAADPQVQSLEATDARRLTHESVEAPALIVCDASFISLRLILPAILPLAAVGARLVALVKPQFEVGPELVVKGLVRDAAARERACDGVADCIAAQGWRVAGRMDSPIAGGDGNREYLIAAQAP